MSGQKWFRNGKLVLFLLCLIIIGMLSACNTGITPPDPPGDTTPEPVPIPGESYTIDINLNGVTLTERGASRQLIATVATEAGVAVPNARVSWHSSTPEVVEVSDTGIVTALTEVGYATIWAEYQGFSSKHVPVAVVKLAPGSRILDDDEVLSASEDGEEVTLKLSDETSTLQVGDIIINEAVLGRITQIDRNELDVRVRTEAVSLPEAFEELSVNSIGETVELEITLSEDGVTVNGDAIEEQQLSLSSLTLGCEAGATFSASDIVFSPGNPIIPINQSATPVVDYEFGPFTPLTMTLAVSQNTTFSRSSDTISLTAGVTFSGSCYLGLPISIPIPVSVVPGVMFTFDIQPKVGFEISATPSFPVTISGPSVSGASAAYTLGLSYSNGTWSPITGPFAFSPGTSTPPTITVFDGELETSFGPFVGVNVGLGINAFGISAVGIDFLKPKAYLALKDTMALPLDFREFSFDGPNWALYGGIKTWMGLQLTGRAKAAFLKLGIGVGFTAAEVDIIKQRLLEAPEITMSVVDDVNISALNSSNSYQKTLNATVSHQGSPIIPLSLYQGWRVRFLAIPDGETTGQIVASALLNSSGQASATWNTLNAEPGNYTVRALLHPLVGNWTPNLVFPYASSDGIDITVAEPTGTIAITSPPSVSAMLEGPREFVAAYHYPFTSNAQVIWRLNGEVVKTEPVQRDAQFNGTARATICVRAPEVRVDVSIESSDFSTVQTSRTYSVLPDLSYNPHAEIIGTSFIATYLADQENEPITATVTTSACGDSDDSLVASWFDAAGTFLAESASLIPELLPEPRTGILQPRTFIANFKLADSELRTQVTMYPCEDGRVLTSRGGRYGPCVTPMSTDVLEKVLARLSNLTTQREALDAVNTTLTDALRRHGVDPAVMGMPRARLVSALSSNYSREFMAYLDALFRSVDAGSPGDATVVLLETLSSLSSGSYTEREAGIILHTAGLVIATFDQFATYSEGGQEAWRQLAFDRDPSSLAERVNRLTPARMALESYLAVLIANPRLDNEASIEIAQYAAARAAVNSVGR